MTEDTIDRLLSRFARAAIEHHEALEALDEERANSQARIIAGLYQSVVREGESARARLLDLVDADNEVVAGMAAVYSLRYCPERSVAVLRRLAAEQSLLGFRATVALERWEAGEWEEA